MMDLHKLRRLAVDVLDMGKERIWFDPEQRDRIREAMTKDDVRALVQDGAIKKKPATGQSSFRTKKLKAQKKKSREKSKVSDRGSKRKKSI